MCRRMTREVYPDSEFIKFSRSNIFMRVMQDTDPQGASLARKYKIDGVPTLIILDSSGKEVDRILGFVSAPELIEELQLIFEAAKEPKYTI
jgi:thioredoxin-related protein